jgi:hypothetical protein
VHLLKCLLLLPAGLRFAYVAAGFVQQVDGLWDEVEQELMGQTAC